MRIVIDNKKLDQINVISERNAKTSEPITKELENWSDTKKTLFSN
jgi:hypothetical protein